MTDPITRLNAALEGHYRIEREIGEGGMAVVYLAEDLRHERKVALKVLKPELAAVVGGERFLAEIKTTANLQHPHILPLFDSGQAESFLYYVMPYVEGDTLRNKIDREKQLGIEEALKITEKVASALDYAHNHGVVHRDIKPGNILLSAEGEPTVADFGIALAVAHAGGGRVTETGLSVGTPHYMSPEQATGDRDVDPRTDVYALGSVLYEMLVGEPPYTGANAQAVLAKILTDPAPAPTKVRLSIPPNVDATIRKALEKLPADRFATAQEFAKALGKQGFRHGEIGAIAVGAAARAGFWKPLAVVGYALMLVFAATTTWLLLRPEPPQPVTRQVLSTEGWAGLDVRIGRFAALAPDGSSMILPIEDQLALKMRGSAEVAPIPGTVLGRDVVYSPDGQWIAYAVGADLFKRPLVGGSAVRLAEDTQSNPGSIAALDWLDDGTILYEQVVTDGDRPRRITRISENGGNPQVVFWPDDGAVAPVWVHGLPGAQGAIVVACPGTTCPPDQARVYVVNLEDLSFELVFTEALRVWYSPTGHLVYVRPDGAVLAQPFDLAELQLTGSAIPLFGGVHTTGGLSGFADMVLGADGTLLYAEGEAADSGGSSQLFWVNRSGTAEAVDPNWQFDPGGNYGWRLSPDGTRVVLTQQVDGNRDIWMKQLPDGPLERLTFDEGAELNPTWSPDGETVIYALGGDLWQRRADGAGVPDLLLGDSDPRQPLQADWSTDGEWIVFRTGSQAPNRGARDIVGFRPGVDSVTVPLVESAEFQEHAPALSPDGRWLAYASDETGRSEIYVRPFPEVDSGRLQVSTDGGAVPRWADASNELFFVQGGERLISARIETDTEFRVLERETLFQLGASYLANGSSNFYDVSPDGQQFLLAGTSQATDGPVRLILVQNFFEELRQLAP